MVDPGILCRQHLLGEHNELHKFIGHLNLERQIDRYIENNCLEPQSIRQRHATLVLEMEQRGYKHHTPLPNYIQISHLPPEVRTYKVDASASLLDLLNRCPVCRGRYHDHYFQKGIETITESD